MSEINVLYCFDSRFSKLATVSIYSLLKNKHDTTHINLYCMVAPHTYGKRKIQKVIDKFPHAKIIWRTIRHNENPFRKHDFSRWSPVIFYRLFACDIFPELNKILYLDSDTIICSDLTELYNTNISDYAMGAVRDMAPIYDKNHPNGRYVYNFAHKYLNDDPYYNSGVLLINAKNMRKNKEILNINIPLKYPDQDLLNAAFHNKILPLELKYNYAPGVIIPTFFSDHEIKTIKHKKYAILHFYSIKPYIYLHIPMYSLFYKLSTELGMHPDEFAKLEQKYIKKQKSTKSCIPGIRIYDDKVTLFGIITFHL